MKNGSIEYIRLLAATSIIWFHIPSAPLRTYAYSGLLIFIMIGVYLTSNSATKSPISLFLKKRASRLLLPWVFWSIIYAIANITFSKPAFPNGEIPLNAILSGSWIGLWYLPFAFIAYLTVAVLLKLETKYNNTYTYTITGSLLLALCQQTRQLEIPTPWPQWIHATPAISFGIAYYFLKKEGNKIAYKTLFLNLLPLCTFLLLETKDYGLFIPYFIAIPICSTCILLTTTAYPILLKTSSLCFGIYLTHGLTLAITNRLITQTNSTIPPFLLALILATALSLTIQKTPFIKRYI